MTKINVTKSINVPASKAWAKIASFRGIENFSPIERSEVVGEGVGAKRTCYLPDGAAINEKLVKVEEAEKTIQYTITNGPFPIEGYLSTVEISEYGSGCRISWTAQYEVEDENKDAMEGLFTGFYNVIIDSLETLIHAEN